LRKRSAPTDGEQHTARRAVVLMPASTSAIQRLMALETELPVSRKLTS
jgi:hypothetical protein